MPLRAVFPLFITYSLLQEMLKTLLFASVLLLAFGCKREYAHFQKTATENFHQPKKQPEKLLIAHEKVEPEPEVLEVIPLVAEPENIVAVGNCIAKRHLKRKNRFVS